MGWFVIEWSFSATSVCNYFKILYSSQEFVLRDLENDWN